MKKYLFVSDIHGEDPKLAEELSIITAKEKIPEIVFFLGDIVGTKLLDKLQKLFYNQIFNPIKNLQKTILVPTDKEILSIKIYDVKTVADGCREIWDFLQKLYPKYEPVNLADYARELASYTHFGHFCSNLPLSIKNVIRQDLEKNATIWIDIMKQFIEKGSLVVVIEGNWDARTPIDFIPIKDKCEPIPVKGRPFYFKELLKSRGGQVQYFDQVGTIATNDEIFVCWPFDCAVVPTKVPEFEDNETRKIILVSHGQIDWVSIKGNTPMTGEGQKIQDNIGMTFKDLKADTAVHGHLHDNISTNGYFFNGKFIHYLPIRTCRFIDF